MPGNNVRAEVLLSQVNRFRIRCVGYFGKQQTFLPHSTQSPLWHLRRDEEEEEDEDGESEGLEIRF